MTLQQPPQQVFDGVVTGFALLIHGIREERRTYDTAKQMEEGSKRLQATWDHQGELPVPLEYKVCFKTDSGEEEDVDWEQYYVPHLQKGEAANKIICKCGAALWRIGKAEHFAHLPPFVCDDCKDVEAIDGAKYLEEIDSDPRDLPQ